AHAALGRVVVGSTVDAAERERVSRSFVIWPNPVSGPRPGVDPERRGHAGSAGEGVVLTQRGATTWLRRTGALHLTPAALRSPGYFGSPAAGARERVVRWHGCMT